MRLRGDFLKQVIHRIGSQSLHASPSLRPVPNKNQHVEFVGGQGPLEVFQRATEHILDARLRVWNVGFSGVKMLNNLLGVSFYRLQISRIRGNAIFHESGICSKVVVFGEGWLYFFESPNLFFTNILELNQFIDVGNLVVRVLGSPQQTNRGDAEVMAGEMRVHLRQYQSGFGDLEEC